MRGPGRVRFLASQGFQVRYHCNRVVAGEAKAWHRSPCERALRRDPRFEKTYRLLRSPPWKPDESRRIARIPRARHCWRERQLAADQPLGPVGRAAGKARRVAITTYRYPLDQVFPLRQLFRVVRLRGSNWSDRRGDDEENHIFVHSEWITNLRANADR